MSALSDPENVAMRRVPEDEQTPYALYLKKQAAAEQMAAQRADPPEDAELGRRQPAVLVPPRLI